MTTQLPQMSTASDQPMSVAFGAGKGPSIAKWLHSYEEKLKTWDLPNKLTKARLCGIPLLTLTFLLRLVSDTDLCWFCVNC
jgi:hypothetical protein